MARRSVAGPAEPVDAACLRPFDALHEAQSRLGRRDRFLPGKKWPECGHGLFGHRRADQVDAQSARKFYGRTAYKTLQRTIDHRARCTHPNGVVVDLTADQREGPSRSNMLDPESNEIHLAHQLAAQSHFELRLRELFQRTKMDVARRAHHGIDLACLGVELFDRLRIGDVDLKVAALPTDPNDLVPRTQRPIHRLAYGPGGSDENDLHDALRSIM